VCVLQQKLVIGDDLGQISCYEFKKGEPQIVFQTAVFDGPVTCVALGGNASKRDKVNDDRLHYKLTKFL
jgi:hypothetical protein